MELDEEGNLLFLKCRPFEAEEDVSVEVINSWLISAPMELRERKKE